MRVAHILSTGALAGTERYVLSLVRHSAHTQIIVCPPDTLLMAELRKLEGVKVVGQRYDYKRFPTHIASIVAVLRREHIDVVHTHLGRATLFGILAAKLAGVPVRITTQHFIRPAYAATHPRLSYPLFLLAHRAMNALLTGTIAISAAVREAAIRREHLAPDRIYLIPHGLDISEYHPLPATVGESSPIIITVARLENEKGLHTWLEAIATICTAMPETQVWLVGEGQLHETLNIQAQNLGITQNVRFLGYSANVADLLRQADLFVLPSPCEPFGISILEAMAARLPVVAVNAGGPAEIVIHGETGLLVPFSARAMAEATITLLQDPALRQRMGAAGRLRVEETYNVMRMVAQTEALYARLLTESGKHPGTMSESATPSVHSKL